MSQFPPSGTVKIGVKRSRSFSDGPAKKNRKTSKNSYRSKVMPVASKSQQEQKYNDEYFTYAISTANQTFRLLNGIGQGDGQSERVGNKINLINLYLRYRILLDEDSSESDSGIRVMLVYDRQPNQALPTTIPYLTQNGEVVNYMNNLNYRGRFYTLYDKVDDLSKQGQFGLSRQVVIPLNTETNFATDADTIAAITNGALYLLALSTTNDSTNPPNIHAQTRVKYTDL